MMYDADVGMWVPMEAADIPITVAGITAQTIGGALAELLDAIDA